MCRGGPPAGDAWAGRSPRSLLGACFRDSSLPSSSFNEARAGRRGQSEPCGPHLQLAPWGLPAVFGGRACRRGLMKVRRLQPRHRQKPPALPQNLREPHTPACKLRQSTFAAKRAPRPGPVIASNRLTPAVQFDLPLSDDDTTWSCLRKFSRNCPGSPLHQQNFTPRGHHTSHASCEPAERPVPERC